MKKASKILTLILVVVLLCGVFSGCAMFGKDVERYRNATAIKVGDQNITVGKLLDTFNTYYNNYYSYVSQGYITVDSLFEMAVTSLYGQYVKVDSFISSATAVDHALSTFCTNAQYLTEGEMQFAIRYIKYLTFQTFDNNVEQKLASKFEIDADEEEDTSRDFTELDDLKGAATYADYILAENFRNEDADEYFDEFYNGVAISNDNKLDQYVYANEQQAKARLDDINIRIEGDEKVTFDQLVDAQKKVVKQYERSVDSTYGISLEKFVTNQVADLVSSAIVAKYNYAVNKNIEIGEGLTATLATLNSNYQILKDAQASGFSVNDSFVSFIEGLTSSSYIYDVPTEYQGQYIFVKNILVPFSDNQKTILTNLASQLGSTEDARYIETRNLYASQIVAEDFLNQDAEGENVKVENLFALEGGKVVINQSGALGQYLKADGSVVAMDGKTQDQTIIELMKQYNTDTAQHTAQYDYVVRTGETPSNYQAKWVTEFVDAANEAKTAGQKHYAIGISSYGVHIVYYSADVVAQTFDFAANRLDTATPEYRLFKAYFEAQASLLLADDLEALQKSYVDAGKITKTKVLDTFLKDNNINFDFEHSLEDEHDHE